MSDTSNPENQIAIEANLTGNAAQQAAELSAQIVNLSQHLATLSQRAVQNANVTKAFNQSMGLSASGVSQYSREITQSLNPLGRMTKAVEIQKRVLDQATKSAEAYSAAQRMLNQSSADPMALTRSNAAMSQSVKHMNAMKLSSNDLQKAMKQVALLDYSRRTSENAMKSQQSAYNFFRNFSLPLITGLREAFFSYSKLATESNRTTKLILDNYNRIGAAGDDEGQIKAARAFTEKLGKDLDKITRDWGTSRVLIQSLAGDFAELGISSDIVLSNLTRMTAETEKLGNLDISQSSEFVQTMYQTILRIRRETGKSVDINDPTEKIPTEIISQLRGQLAVFNMIENKTVMSLRNIADAFPEVTAAATSFGLSMTEAMSLVIPMIGAGFQVGASANSVKVSLQRMVAMTKQNTQIINQLNAEMGTGFKYSAGVGMENIQMLTDAYRTLSKSVSEGGKGKQGALEFFSRLFGVRQGPRMETAFAQLAAFQTSLETYGSVERTTADILQNSINVELAAIGSKKIAIKQFLDLSNIHRMAIEKDSNDVLTAQALAIQKGQQKAQKLLESANGKNSDFISGMSTEVGKALMAQAFDVNSLAGKQFEAELKLSQDTPEVRYRRAKESLMALGRAVVPVVDVFLKGLLPVLEKLATFLQNNPFVAKLVSALLGLVALSGPLRMIFTTMQTAFGGAVGLFVKLSRVISGTTLQFASLQDLIMNPNLLRGQQRVVQYLDGFLIKSKRGARELKEAYDFSGISLPAKEAIQAGGIYGSEKAVNMKRMQPFVPQTNQFMDDLKAINAQGAAQSAAQVAAGAESGVTKGAANLSDDIVAQFANAMHRFQGPNLFAGPNYFQNNIPFDGTPGSSRTPRAPKAPAGTSGTAKALTKDEIALAANEARKARLRPPTVTTYPKGTLFPTSTAKSFNDLEKTLDRLKKTSGRILFSPANAAAGAAQAASAVARPQAPFNPAQLLANISQNRIALGNDPLSPIAIRRFLSEAADNVTLSFDQIRSWYIEAGKEITDELEYAFSRGGVWRVSKETLDEVKRKIFQKGKGSLFTLGGTDRRLTEGTGATITNASKLGKKIQDELAPIVKAVSDDIVYQVDEAINQSQLALNKLKINQLFQGKIGKNNLVVSRLASGGDVLVSDLDRVREELFIAIDKSGEIIQHDLGALNQYADDLDLIERNVRGKTHRFVEFKKGRRKYINYVKNPIVESAEEVALREADELARQAIGSGSDALEAEKAAVEASKPKAVRADYALNKKIEEARIKLQKLREAKIDALSRVKDYTPPLPTTEPILKGRLGALDEAIKGQNDEIEKEIERFKAAKNKLKSVISQETDLETTKTGKSRIRAAGKRRMKELQEEHDWELNLLRKQQAKMIADRNRVLNSPAAIQRQIDDTLATLPKDVRAAVQDVDRAISDEMKQLSKRTDSRIARMNRALAGVGKAKVTTARAAVPMSPMWNAIPSQIKQMGSDGSPLDVFKYKGSRFFNDPRFQQPNARMFDARRGLSLPTSIKSFFGMDRVKPLFKFPKSLSAAFDYTQFTGSDIIMRFADSLEEQLLTVVSTSQTEVKHISEVMRRLASTKTKHKHLPNVLKNFLAATMNIPGMTQDQIESMINLSVNNVVNDVTKTFKGGTAGRDGLKSGTPASLKAFFERLRKKTQGLDGEKMGLQELLFGSSLIKLKEGENFGTSRGITGALQNVVYQSMSGGFVGLGGSFDEGVPKVKKRGINDWWRPLAFRKNAAKNAPKGVGKKVVEELADTLNESVDDAIEMVDEIQNEIQEQLVAPVQKAVNNVKPKVNVYKPGELFPGRAPVIPQAAAPSVPNVRDLEKAGIIAPTTKKQAEKMIESAQRELARQLGIDAKASGASAKIKKLSALSFEKEIERVKGMIAGEQQLLNTFTSPAMRKGPEKNLANLNAQLQKLSVARDKYVVAEAKLAEIASGVVPSAPSKITPTGATGATAPTAPPPRVPTPTAPAIPTPTAPSATGGAGKVIDVKKFGQVFKGPNLFHGPNIFDSSLSDLIPNFDELLSPVGEAAEEMADAGAEVAASLSRVLAAGEARKLTGNLVGPGEAGKVSRLSGLKNTLFGKKGVDVPSIKAGLDAAQIAKTAGLVDALDAKKLKLKFDDAGALIGMARIKKLGGEMGISFDRANSILAGRLLPNFTRLKKFFSSGIVKGWAFALTGGLSAAVKPAQSLLKALTATGETSIRGKARAAIDNLVESRGKDDKKTGFVRKAMAGLSGATGGINSLAAAGSKAADILFKIGTAIAMIGTVAVIALPIIVLMFGIFQAWKSAQGRLGATTEALKQSLTNLKEAISALFAPLRDMVNGFLGADNIGGTFMTQSEKNAAMFYGIATAIKKATEGIKNWAKTTGKAFMSNQVAPFLARLINRFILLGGAIKSAFSGDKEGAMKKFKAFMYSLLYELLNFTKGIVELIGALLKALIPVFVYIAKAGVIVFKALFQELVRMAADSAFSIGKFLAQAIPSIGIPIKIFDAITGGEEAGDEFSSGFEGSITKGLSDLVDPLKKGLNSTLTAGMSGVAKRYAELMGQGINIPLAQRLKNPKAYQDALKYNAKQSADAATAAGESLGSNVANGIKDKMKEIKDTIKGYFYSNVDAKFDSIIQQYTDALNKQKDEQLKAYDDQIAGIDALADAEERLTAKKDYETKRREMIDQRETDRSNYLVERRLAVYEGRAFDVRKLDREEVLAQRNSSKEIQELDSGRLSQLQSEQRDLAKQAISNQKDLAEKQFQEVLDTFDRFIEDVKNKSFATQEEFAAALAGVGEQANLSSAELSRVFAANIGELPRIIAGVRDPSINMFNTNMDDLIREASNKFGLDANVANPTTLLGAVRMMAIGSEEGFKAAFNPAFATAYVQPAIAAIAKITSSLSEKGNKNNIAEIWQKAGEDAFAKLRAELNRDIAFPKILDSFKKLLDDLKPLIAQIVALAGEANSSLGGIGDDIVAGASFTAEDRNALSTYLLRFAPTDAGRRDDLALNSPSLQRVVGLIMRDYDKGNQYMLSNINSYGLTGLERMLLQGYLTNQMLGSGTPSMLRPRGNNVIISYNGGHIPQFVRGGFLNAPSSVGIPALLHGGEYIINHKAVEKFGKGNLERINALRHGGDLKGFASGGYMTTPGFANGGYMTTPGFAKGGIVPDRFEAKQKLSSQIANAERAKILAKNKLPTNFIGPVAEPKEKSWWQTPLSVVKEILRPKNSFAVAGALLAGFFGTATGPGAVGTAVAGAAVGGAVGEWVEQLFDKKKGIQPLDIVKNAAVQGIFQLAGIGVGKVIAKFAKPALKSVKPALMDKLPGVGSYLEGKLVRPWLNPLKNIFKKPGIDSFDSSVLNPENIVDVGLKELPAPPKMLELNPGPVIPKPKMPDLDMVERVIHLGYEPPPLPTAKILPNYILHGGPNAEELLGGIINPEFIRGGHAYAALRGTHYLDSYSGALRSATGLESVINATEGPQSQGIIKTYREMLEILVNRNAYMSGYAVPSRIPGYKPPAVPGFNKAGEVAWDKQVKMAEEWIAQYKEMVTLTMSGHPHSTGVSILEGGNAPYAFTTGYGAAHLLKVPDELLIRNSANIGAAGADMASEILFYGSHKPLASIKAVNTPESLRQFYAEVANAIADDTNRNLSQTVKSAYIASTNSGNTITPGSRGMLLHYFDTISNYTSDAEIVKKSLLAAKNGDEIMQIISRIKPKPEATAYESGLVSNTKDFINTNLTPALVRSELSSNLINPPKVPLIESGADATMLGVMDDYVAGISGATGRLTVADALISANDRRIIEELLNSNKFMYMDPVSKNRYLEIIKAAMRGEAVNADLIHAKTGLNPKFPSLPSPYDVLQALAEGVRLSSVKNMPDIPRFANGGYLQAPVSQGIPALLHGGEYIINHKAVEKFGKGNLERINSLKNGGDFKGFASGGYMTTPGFANGGYMTTPGFAKGGFLKPGFGLPRLKSFGLSKLKNLNPLSWLFGKNKNKNQTTFQKKPENQIYDDNSYYSQLPEPQFIGNMPPQLAYVNDAANTQREIARGMVNYAKNNALIIRGLKKIYVNPLYWNDENLFRNDGDAAFRIAANYSTDFLVDTKRNLNRGDINTDHSEMLAMHQGISDAMATMSTYLGVPFEFAGPKGIPDLSKGNQMLLNVGSVYSPRSGYAAWASRVITSQAAKTPSRIAIPRTALNTKRIIESSMDFNVGGSNMGYKDPLIHNEVFMHEFGHIGGFDHPHEYLDAVKEKYGHNHSEEMLNSIMSYDSNYAGKGYLLPADINAWRSNMGYGLAAPTIVKRLDRQWSLQGQPIAGGTPKYNNWLQSPSKFSKDKKQLPKVKKFEQGGFIGPMLPKKKKSFWGKVAGIGKGAFNIGKEILRPKNSFAIAGGTIAAILAAPGGPAAMVAAGMAGSAAGGGIGSFVEQAFDKKKGFQPLDIGKNMLLQGAMYGLGAGAGAVAKRFVMPALAKYAKPGLSKAASLLKKGIGKMNTVSDNSALDGFGDNYLSTFIKEIFGKKTDYGRVQGIGDPATGLIGNVLRADNIAIRDAKLQANRLAGTKRFLLNQDGPKNPFPRGLFQSRGPITKIADLISNLNPFQQRIGMHVGRPGSTEILPNQTPLSGTMDAIDGNIYSWLKGSVEKIVDLSRGYAENQGFIDQNLTRMGADLLDGTVIKQGSYYITRARGAILRDANIVNSPARMSPSAQVLQELPITSTKEELATALAQYRENSGITGVFNKVRSNIARLRNYITGESVYLHSSPTQGLNEIKPFAGAAIGNKDPLAFLKKATMQPDMTEGVWKYTGNSSANARAGWGKIRGTMPAPAPGGSVYVVRGPKGMPTSSSMFDDVDPNSFVSKNPLNVLSEIKIPSTLTQKEALAYVDAAVRRSVTRFGGPKTPRFKKGGYINSKESRAVPAVLHGGEYVLNAGAVKKYGLGHIEAMNKMQLKDPKPNPENPDFSIMPIKPKPKPRPKKPDLIIKPIPKKPDLIIKPIPKKPDFSIPTPVPEKPDFSIPTPVPEKPDFSIMPIPKQPDFSIMPIPKQPDFSIPTPVPGKPDFSTGPFNPIIEKPDFSIMPIPKQPDLSIMPFNVPSAGFSVPQSSYSGSAAGGMTTSTQNVNIYVDNFIGEPEWFNTMMKDYNTKILPKNQKAAGLENRVISTYNGLNRGQ